MMTGVVEVTTPEQWGLSPSAFQNDDKEWTDDDREWKCVLVHFRQFATHPNTKGLSFESPEFHCNGHKWSLRIYPSGNTSNDSSDDDFLFTDSCCFMPTDLSNSESLSLYLNHCSQGSTSATFETKIINKYGDTVETRRSSNNRRFDSSSRNSGWSDIIKLSDVLDESKNILDSDGTLTIAVLMKQEEMPEKSHSSPKVSSPHLSLPNEPSWMKPPVIVGTLSNEGVEVDQIDSLRQSMSIDDCSTRSVDDAVGLSEHKSRGYTSTIRDSWTDPTCTDDCRDDKISVGSCSFEDDASVSTLDEWGLPTSMFQDDKQWKSFLIHFHHFGDHPTTKLAKKSCDNEDLGCNHAWKGLRLDSPEFQCNGQKWSLRVYPGGNTSSVGNAALSLYLNHRSRGSATATFEAKIINKYGDTLETRRSTDNRHFDSGSSNSGWSNIIKLADVLDESKDILDSNGALTVVVSMKKDPSTVIEAETEENEIDIGTPNEDDVSVTTLDVWNLSPSTFNNDKQWKSFLIHFHHFADHPSPPGHRLDSREFTCNGQKWSLRIYPGGNSTSNEGSVSLYLNHRSRGSATATFEAKIINKYGDTIETRRSADDRHFDSGSRNSGWSNIIKLSDILDESKDILDSDGTLTVVISMKKELEDVSSKALTSDQESELVLKKLVIKCLLRNQQLPANTIIGSRGRGQALRLPKRDPSLESTRSHLPKTRDPPEEVVLQTAPPVSIHRPLHTLPLTNHHMMSPERHVRILESPSRGVLSQPPRPDQVRYPLFSPSGNLQASPTSVCTDPVLGNELYSHKTVSSVPGQLYVGERGLSSHAINRRRHYKEMLLQNQLAQTQAQLIQCQRQLAAEHFSITS